jgi:hypothetical protein
LATKAIVQCKIKTRREAQWVFSIMKIAHKENGEKEENEVEEEEKEKNCKRKSHLASFGAKKNLVGFSCKWDHI